MALEIDDLLLQMRCHDVDPETADRIRMEARERFGRRSSAVSRAYDRVLEPVLMVAAIVASLSWALGRIWFLTR